QRLIDAYIDDFLPKFVGIEEIQFRQGLKQALMAFGQQRDVQNIAAGGRTCERYLVRNDGLASPWAALDDVRGAIDQPTVQNSVESLDSARRTSELLHLKTP